MISQQLLLEGRFEAHVEALFQLRHDQKAAIQPALVDPAIDWLCDEDQPERAAQLVSAYLSAGVEVDAPIRCAQMLGQKGNREGARALLLAWNETRHAQPWNTLRIANTLHTLEFTDTAVALLEQGVTDFPKNPGLPRRLAQLLMISGRRQEAVAQLDRLVGLSLNQPAWVFSALRVLREGGGHMLGLDVTAPDDVISARILVTMLAGGYERGERRAVLEDLRPTDRVLELGAGFGAIAMWINAAMPEVPVTTVEANPALAPVIRQNFALNGCDARLIEGIASANGGSSDFHLAEHFWASSTNANRFTGPQVKLPNVDVNALIAEFDPTVLIIDIEGSEVDLIPALTLDGVRRIVVEIHPEMTTMAEYSGVFRTLLNAGFDIDRTLKTGEVFVFVRPDGAENSA